MGGKRQALPASSSKGCGLVEAHADRRTFPSRASCSTWTTSLGTAGGRQTTRCPGWLLQGACPRQRSKNGRAKPGGARRLWPPSVVPLPLGLCPRLSCTARRGSSLGAASCPALGEEPCASNVFVALARALGIGQRQSQAVCGRAAASMRTRHDMASTC